MRSKLLISLLMAGTVVGCASNPPPPPPMAAAPAPMPAPAPMMGPVDGAYRGTAELAADAPRSCRKMTKMQTVRVRNNSFVMNGVKMTINPDGSLTGSGKRASMMSGTASATGLDVTSMQGKCSYRYTLNKA